MRTNRGSTVYGVSYNKIMLLIVLKMVLDGFENAQNYQKGTLIAAPSFLKKCTNARIISLSYLSFSPRQLLHGFDRTGRLYNVNGTTNNEADSNPSKTIHSRRLKLKGFIFRIQLCFQPCLNRTKMIENIGKEQRNLFWSCTLTCLINVQGQINVQGEELAKIK